MAASTGGWVKRTFRFLGGWLYDVVFKGGWQRWLLLAVIAVALFLITATVFEGVNYKEDPSALVPRSVDFYAESGSLSSLLGKVGTWDLWAKDKRASGNEQWNQLQLALAGRIGNQVRGLGTRLPLIWMASAQRAAFALMGEADGDPESWALYLLVPDTGTLAEIGVEPGMNVSPQKPAADGNVYELSGNGEDGGKLFIGEVKPWLIIASSEKLPKFAADSLKKPAYSLSKSAILPVRMRKTAFRGMFNPNRFGKEMAGGLSVNVEEWIAQDARIAYSMRFLGEGEMEGTISVKTLAENIPGGGLWPLFKFVLGVFGVVLLVLALAIIMVMVGLGGWLKVQALRLGITPASQPAHVEPSNAFKQDAGIVEAERVEVDNSPALPAHANLDTPQRQDPEEGDVKLTVAEGGTDNMKIDTDSGK